MDRILGFDAQFLIELGFQLFNTLCLTAFLGFILYKPVLNFMRKRSERISNQILEAETGLENAKKLQAEYETKLSRIEQERFEILEQARQQAHEKEQRILSEARQNSETILKRAENEIKLEYDKAKDEIKTQIVEVSSLMAGRFIAAKIDSATQNQLLDQAISDLGDAKWLK